MIWELYEVWAEGDDSHDELIDTTKSRKEALEIAEAQLALGYVSSVVYQETEDGDLVEVKRFEQ